MHQLFRARGDKTVSQGTVVSCLADAKVLYFSGLTKLFAVFFQFTPVTGVGSALYHLENAQGSIANGDDKD